MNCQNGPLVNTTIWNMERAKRHSHACRQTTYHVSYIRNSRTGRISRVRDENLVPATSSYSDRMESLPSSNLPHIGVGFTVCVQVAARPTVHGRKGDRKHTGVEVQLHTFLSSVSSHLHTPPGQNPNAHWPRVWVRPRAGLDFLKKRKIFCPHRDSQPRQASR
jgi:hypothetical protein